ncbi:unnamed protein product [Mycena citricolor]|uniref:Major facilitator superfamily (MFS) profile domain-containing protein n=1 Tax=Mycena citricolor TaxID=2018698 RepID=A0AAD2Q3L5_9AGAR|nr:unnamed protein product [Mycena citricolor]
MVVRFEIDACLSTSQTDALSQSDELTSKMTGLSVAPPTSMSVHGIRVLKGDLPAVPHVSLIELSTRIASRVGAFGVETYLQLLFSQKPRHFSACMTTASSRACRRSGSSLDIVVARGNDARLTLVFRDGNLAVYEREDKSSCLPDDVMFRFEKRITDDRRSVVFADLTRLRLTHWFFFRSMSQTQGIELSTRATSAVAHSESSQVALNEQVAADAPVPDGGYGWVVVASCAVITGAALVQQGLGSSSTISFVGSTAVACISGLAIINARVIRLLGTQRTALLGITIIGLGQILSGFATKNIGALFVTTGVINGIGISLCFMVVSITPGQYFQKKRGLANGIVYAGGGLGGAVTSFLIDALLSSLGPAWTFHILGILTLTTGLPAAWFVKERTRIRTNTFIDWALFRDPRFITLFLAGAVGTFPLFVPPFFLPLYANSLRLPARTGAALLAGFNSASAAGRLGAGFAADRVGPVNVLFAALLLSAVSMLAIWPVSTALAPLAMFVVINGAANGGFFSTMPTVVGTVFGVGRVSVAMGMIATGWVGGYLMGAPIAGYILNAYGGADSTLSAYHPAMFYAGSMAAAAAGLVLLVRFKISTDVLSRV